MLKDCMYENRILECWKSIYGEKRLVELIEILLEKERSIIEFWLNLLEF